MSHLRLAIRRLLQQPGFSVLALFTLAVGLGANAAIFSVVDAVLLRPLDYPGSERLVSVGHEAPGLDLMEIGMSDRLYLHYRDHAETFESIGLYDDSSMAISGLERPLQVYGAALSPSVLEMLDAQPILGRRFLDVEGDPGQAEVALISEDFWKQELGGDPNVLDRTLNVDGAPRPIVGVLPSSFDFPRHGLDIWLPYTVDPATVSLGNFGSRGVALLNAGVSLDVAAADLQRFTGDLEGTFPEENASKVLADGQFSATLKPLREEIIADVGPVLWVLLATVGFVLLLATVNVATLFLARAEKRQRETAIRSALGAGRGALATASLAEGMLLSLGAGVLGVLIGKQALVLLFRLAPDGLPRAHEVAVDGRTVAAVALLSVLSGLVFSLIPLFRSRLHELASQLKDGGRSATLGQGRHRVRRSMVAAQMAIAVVLLVGAGLMARSFEKLANVDPGFKTADALSFRLSLPASKVEHDMEAAHFFQRLLDDLGAIPGVRSVASTTGLPLSGRRQASGHRTRDEIDRGEGEMPTMIGVQQVSPGYFSTMGMPIIEGRALERSDYERRSSVAVVSKHLADLKWPGESPIGKKIFPGTPAEDEPWFEVVGVVGNVRSTGLQGEEGPEIYYPWASGVEDMWVASRQSIVLRVSGDHDPILEAARQAVWALDGDLPLAEIQTLEAFVEDARAETAFTAMMLLIAAGVAVLLGAVGTYGLISFLVAERTGEIGIRLALGAQRFDVLRLIVREGLLLATIGGALGLLASAALARGLDAVLFEVEPHDPMTFGVVPVVLLLVALAASVLPARRAAGLDPVVALRGE